MEKLLETSAFSYGKISSCEPVQKEHKHFHPSGDPKPSPDDIATTKSIQKAAELIGIELVDHIVVGHGSSVSLKELGCV